MKAGNISWPKRAACVPSMRMRVYKMVVMHIRQLPLQALRTSPQGTDHGDLRTAPASSPECPSWLASRALCSTHTA